MAAILDSEILYKRNFTHCFWFNVMMAAILNSAILDSAILLKTLIPTNSIWLKVIHSVSFWWWQPSWIHPFCRKKIYSFILTQLDDGSHLEFCQFEFYHLGFSHNSFSSQTHSHLLRLVPNICTKKNFTHSFWLNLMMAAILNAAMLDSDTAMLDSDTLLSSHIDSKTLSLHSDSDSN